VDVSKRKIRARLLALATAFLVLASGCGDGGPADGDGGADGVEAGADVRRDVSSADAAFDADPSSDAAISPPPDAGTFTELPQLTADPSLTRRVLSGPAYLLGSGVSACSHGASSERWCAFSKSVERDGGAKTELWVINISKVIGGESISCDESGPDCLSLTSDLFTGTQFPGPFHPFDHRFDGDTLIFYADFPPGAAAHLTGPVWVWRQGWTRARQLTSTRGGLCFAEHRAPVAHCTDAVVARPDPSSILGIPIYSELDLLAGRIDDPSGGPLAKVEHLAATGDASLVMRARYSPAGDTFAFSHVPPGEKGEVLEVIRTADVGRAAPTTILTNASQWEIAHDGAAVYFLRGFDRTKGVLAEGDLGAAQFPSGLMPVTLRPAVAEFQLLGAHGEIFSSVDRGVAFYSHAPNESWTLSVMLDRAKADEVLGIGKKPYQAEISTDARHVVHLEDPVRPGYRIAYVSRTDGAGVCVLTIDPRAESYGLTFSDDGSKVFWIEYGRSNARSEEGWYARPEDCTAKTKFGDYLAYYRLIGDDFVVFEGSDADDSTNWLEYTPLAKGASEKTLLPTIIVGHPETFTTIVSGGKAFVLYSVARDGGFDGGLYLFGPLTRAQ